MMQTPDWNADHYWRCPVGELDWWAGCGDPTPISGDALRITRERVRTYEVDCD